jgi:hypothetical protein
MAHKIIKAWESPRNEGTEVYIVGNERPGRGWRVGRIEMLALTWIEGPGPQEFLRFANSRVDIYDDNDKLRASLPTSAAAVEYAGEEG